ncbi:MAG: hypothetical protein H6Q90_2148 [Deltaproteobacteria bacterium]|nr:hypothetical protein [Deltaproteobacteria bacterium]
MTHGAIISRTVDVIVAVDVIGPVVVVVAVHVNGNAPVIVIRTVDG